MRLFLIAYGVAVLSWFATVFSGTAGGWRPPQWLLVLVGAGAMVAAPWGAWTKWAIGVGALAGGLAGTYHLTVTRLRLDSIERPRLLLRRTHAEGTHGHPPVT